MFAPYRPGQIHFLCMVSCLLFFNPLVAQEEVAEVEAELERLRVEAELKFTEEHRTFLDREFPEALDRLRHYGEAASGPEPEAEVVHRHLEFQLQLAQLTTELSHAKRFNRNAFEALKEYHRLELASHILAERYHQSEDAKERDRIEKSLRKNLEEGFRISQEMREMEAREVEKEVKRIWALLKKRQENKEAIVERRFSQLILGADPFEW